MLVQGDRLNIINIKGVIDTIFSNSEHDRRKQSIANPSPIRLTTKNHTFLEGGFAFNSPLEGGHLYVIPVT